MVIVVAGMIGVGKSTLTKILAEELATQAFYESVEDNPILEKFYISSEEEIQRNRYPFLLQLWFLNTRFKSIKEALVNDNNVLDRSIYEDWYFAKVNKELGRISDLEFDIYEGLLDNMLEELAELPKKSPDLLVYLKADFQTILDRIAGRGRDFEIDPALVEYYHTLWKGYDEWLLNHYKASQVVIINAAEVDYVNNEEDKKAVVNDIKKVLDEIRK